MDEKTLNSLIETLCEFKDCYLSQASFQEKSAVAKTIIFIEKIINNNKEKDEVEEWMKPRW